MCLLELSPTSNNVSSRTYLIKYDTALGYINLLQNSDKFGKSYIINAIGINYIDGEKEFFKMIWGGEIVDSFSNIIENDWELSTVFRLLLSAEELE
jgi:hypothetical protein